ncbi:hypothetical protein J6590_074274 [Homalodisca vitripennis]|nr:hypothetical protein J6590_074274 [Homalodisca vitripennis]
MKTIGLFGHGSCDVHGRKHVTNFPRLFNHLRQPHQCSLSNLHHQQSLQSLRFHTVYRGISSTDLAEAWSGELAGEQHKKSETTREMEEVWEWIRKATIGSANASVCVRQKSFRRNSVKCKQNT